MVENCPVPVQLKINFPLKPYILTLRMNILREISSYLTSSEFTEFCITCRYFIKLIDDKFISKQVSIPKPIIPFPMSKVDLIHDYHSIQLISENKFPSVNVEWKSNPIKYFHYCTYDSRKLVFLQQERSFEIREIKNFSFGLNPIYSKAFNEKIIKAAGYKNKVVLLFCNKIEIIELDCKIVFFNELNEENKTFCFEFTDEVPKTIKILNSGRNCLLVTKVAAHLLSFKMKLMTSHRRPQGRFAVVVPSIRGKNYLIYGKEEVKVYKVGNSQEKVVKVEFNIAYVRTSHFSSAPQIIISCTNAEVYQGSKKLEIRTEAKFWLFNEFIVFNDYCSRYAVTVYNLELNQEIYKKPIFPLTSCLKNAVPSAFKLIYSIDEKIFMENMHLRRNVNLELSFEQLSKFRFVNNMLILSGRIYGHYAVIILDLSRSIAYEEYIKAISAPKS